MSDVEDEIKAAQRERLSFKASLSAKSVSYDEDIYGGGTSSEFNSELTLDDDDTSTKYSTESREVVRKALSSYTAPKHLLESRPKIEKQEEADPFQEHKRKTVAEREDEYRARWRKRKLSPPRLVAFGKQDKKTSGEARSYKEIMMEQQLEKEKHEVLRKIQKKKEEEEEDRKQRLKDKNNGTLWDVKEDGSKEKTTDRRKKNEWAMNVMKSGQQVGAPVILDAQTVSVFTIGRDRASNMPVDHPSCSKHHANITFKSFNGAIVPHVTDLGSTNGTKVNGRAIEAHKATPIKGGDTVKFGESTREYTFLQKD